LILVVELSDTSVVSAGTYGADPETDAAPP